MTLVFGFTVILLIAGCATERENLTVTNFGLGFEANKAVPIDDRLYFTDDSEILYTWEEAREYCRLEDGELAKVTNRNLYNNLRLSVSQKAIYWIDGIETQNWYRFDMDMSCSPENQFELDDMNPENVDLRPNQCLGLLKGDNARTSKIIAADCNIPNRVLCARPLTGCVMYD